MKRLNLWLRELSLSQQLMAIIFLFLSAFTLFLFLFVSPTLDRFSENEMYHLLHNAQENLASYIEQSDDYRSGIAVNQNSFITEGVCHPDGTLTIFGNRTLPSSLKEDIIEQAGVSSTVTLDYQFRVSEDDTYSEFLYCLTWLANGDVLVSVMDNAYRAQFQTTLVNEVVTMNAFVVFVLFLILMVWVSTLLVPLNQIKAYITKVKNDEPAELNVHRRDAIGEVADALREMEGELEKQNREKEEMIQNISHDLKTPIATIKSYGESIKDGIYPYDTLEKSVDVIIEHADRLQKKVQSLIVLNKMDYLEDNGPDGDTVYMNGVIDKVILSLKMVRPEIDLQKKTKGDVYFHGVEDPWRIVIENLVDNGLRYAQSHIRITLEEDELCVINDGNPIKEEDRERIFHPYEKGTDGKFGLGLSIVAKVCSTYGYHVAAENLPGEVCFRIWRDSKSKPKKKKKTNKTRTKG